MTVPFIAKAAVGSLMVLAFLSTFAQGLTGNANIRRCQMDKFDHSGRVGVDLTVSPQTIVVQFDDGKPYVLVRNVELSTDGFTVAGAGNSNGSVSLVIDKDGGLQMTVLTPGDDPAFAYGECG